MSIELKDLHKSFGDLDVLKGFSLEVQEGETLSIIGHSGAGKSVTLKSVLGLIQPDRGEIWVDGSNVHELKQSDLYELRHASVTALLVARAAAENTESVGCHYVEQPAASQH